MRISLRLRTVDSILLFSRLAYSIYARSPLQNTLWFNQDSAATAWTWIIKVFCDVWSLRMYQNVLSLSPPMLNHWSVSGEQPERIALQAVMAADDPDRFTKNNSGATSSVFLLPSCSSVSVFLVAMTTSSSRKLRSTGLWARYEIILLKNSQWDHAGLENIVFFL